MPPSTSKNGYSPPALNHTPGHQNPPTTINRTTTHKTTTMQTTTTPTPLTTNEATTHLRAHRRHHSFCQPRPRPCRSHLRRKYGKTTTVTTRCHNGGTRVKTTNRATTARLLLLPVTRTTTTTTMPLRPHQLTMMKTTMTKRAYQTTPCQKWGRDQHGNPNRPQMAA